MFIIYNINNLSSALHFECLCSLRSPVNNIFLLVAIISSKSFVKEAKSNAIGHSKCVYCIKIEVQAVDSYYLSCSFFSFSFSVFFFYCFGV